MLFFFKKYKSLNYVYMKKRAFVYMMDVHSNNEDLNESDPRSNVHYLGSGENKAWKKFRPVRTGPYRPEFFSGLIFTTA